MGPRGQRHAGAADPGGVGLFRAAQDRAEDGQRQASLRGGEGLAGFAVGRQAGANPKRELQPGLTLKSSRNAISFILWISAR